MTFDAVLPATIGAFTSAQFAGASSAQIQGLSAAAFNELSAADIGEISADLTTTQMSLLSNIQIGGLNCSAITSTQFAAIAPTLIASLTTTQISQMFDQFKGLTPQQASQLSAAQLGALYYDGTHVATEVFSAAAASAITPSAITGLSTLEIGLAGATPTSGFTSDQLNVFSAAQLNEVDFSYLSVPALQGIRSVADSSADYHDHGRQQHTLYCDGCI